MIKWNDKEVLGKAKKGYRKSLVDACEIVVNSTVKHFQTSGITGATKAQRRVAADKSHAASPGGIPFVQTGTLSRSIGYEIVKEDGELEGHVGPRLGYKDKKTGEEAANYGKWLELGTPKMKPHPYLRPALAREHKRVMAQFKDWF